MSVEMFRKEPKKFEDKYSAFYKAKFERLARNMFKWTISEKHVTGDLIERYLWTDGLCILFRHETLGWIVTRATETAWNVNGYATAWKPVADMNIPDVDMPDELTEADCVPIYEWAERYIRRTACLFLCDEISDVNETIRQQVWNQKTPLMVISGNVQNREKLRNSVISIAENAKAIFLDKDISGELKALDLNAPFNIVELQQHKKAIENEVLDWLGIDYQDAIPKKERMIVDEQEANDESLNYTLADMLNERLKACDKMNEFGLVATVEVQRSVRPADSDMDGDPEQPDDNEGGDNGTA